MDLPKYTALRQKVINMAGCGCLAPKYIHAWEWIEIAIKYNNPASFMNDMDLYRRALTDAWESGGEWLARDLLHVVFRADNINKQN